MITNGLLKFSLIAVLGVLSQRAKAVTTPPLQDIITSGGSAAGTCLGTCDNQGASGLNAAAATSYSSASNSAGLSNSPSLSSFAAVGLYNGVLGTGSFSASSSATAELQYYFEIDGPKTISIPVLVQASASLKSTGGSYSSPTSGIGAYSSALFGLVLDHPNAASTEIIYQNATVNYGIGDTGGVKTSSFNVDSEFTLMTNTVYRVLMDVDSNASIYTGPYVTAAGGLTTQASIDPTFTVDPAYAGDYTITFSEGLANPATTVPLPPALPLFGSALAALFGLGMGKKRSRQVLAH
jgi:hypothetical protein